jgi:hypothetical protein
MTAGSKIVSNRLTGQRSGAIAGSGKSVGRACRVCDEEARERRVDDPSGRKRDKGAGVAQPVVKRPTPTVTPTEPSSALMPTTSSTEPHRASM